MRGKAVLLFYIPITKSYCWYFYQKKYPVRESNPYTYLYNRYALSFELTGHLNYIVLLFFCQLTCYFPQHFLYFFPLPQVLEVPIFMLFIVFIVLFVFIVFRYLVSSVFFVFIVLSVLFVFLYCGLFVDIDHIRSLKLVYHIFLFY